MKKSQQSKPKSKPTGSVQKELPPKFGHQYGNAAHRGEPQHVGAAFAGDVGDHPRFRTKAPVESGQGGPDNDSHAVPGHDAVPAPRMDYHGRK